jgi:hypothetical protein
VAELQRWEAHNSGFQSRLALSRESVVERAQDHAGRIREVDLAAALQHLGDSSTQSASVYVCGSNAFVERDHHAARLAGARPGDPHRTLWRLSRRFPEFSQMSILSREQILAQRYRSVRQRTERLCAPLSVEDHVPQPTPR